MGRALRFGWILLALAALPGLSLAQSQVSVNGLPYDVEIADAGVLPDGGTSDVLIGVATSTGWATIQGRNGSFGFPVNHDMGELYVSVDFDPSGCPYTYAQGGTVTACGWEYNLPDQWLPDSVYRVRHTSRGAAYVQDEVSNEPKLLFRPAYERDAGAWVRDAAPGVYLGPTSTDKLSALSYDDVELGLAGTSANTLVLMVDGGVAYGPFIQDAGALGEIALFADVNGVRALLGTTTRGLVQVPFVDGGTRLGNISQTSIDGGSVTGVAFALGTGNDGFGMAVVSEGSGYRLYGAVPDPAHPAEKWVPRAGPTFSGGNLVHVSCVGAAVCVFTSDVVGTGGINNILIYENRSPPTMVTSDITLSDGNATPFTYAPNISDTDFDPYFVQWAIDAGTPVLLSGISPEGDSVDLKASGLVCTGNGFETYALFASVSDGQADHTSTKATSVKIVHSVHPGVPSVLPDPAAASIPAGSGTYNFTAQPGDGGCSPTSYTWAGTPPPGYTFTSWPSGLLSVTPPPTICQPQTVTYFLVASDGVLDSGTQTVDFEFERWGAPDAAFPPGEMRFQDAGESVTYLPMATHACEGYPEFPGVATEWTFPGSGSTAGLVPAAAVGAQPVDSGVRADALTLTFPDCRQGTFVLGAQNFLQDGGFDGPMSELSINVAPRYRDVQAASVGVSILDAGAIEVTGALASDVNCAADRGLEGHFEVQHVLTGTTVAAPPGSVPGAYTVPLSFGCSGGDFDAFAWISDPDGGTSSVAQTAFSLPQLDVGAVLAGSTLAARCGEGASGTVAATFPAGTCPTSEVSWSQVAGEGPELQPVANGTSATFHTVDGGLDGLIGSWVRVRASVDGGLGNAAEVFQLLQIVPEPLFVRVVHDTDAPVAEEVGILGVRVRMTNETDCPVTHVTLHEQAKDLRYIYGTARLDGVPLEPSSVEPELLFDDISLAAHQTRTLTYSGRPTMLGTVSPKGWASMNGVPVSDAGGLMIPPPAPGCGCGQSPGGAMAFALALLAQAVRRRLRARS